MCFFFTEFSTNNSLLNTNIVGYATWKRHDESTRRDTMLKTLKSVETIKQLDL